MGQHELIEEVNAELLAEGFIQLTGEVRNGQPVYAITEAGHAYLREQGNGTA